MHSAIADPTSPTPDPKEFLKVDGPHFILHGQPQILRGVCLGGWMVMENFLTGYPAHEHQMRAGLLRVLGREKYEYYFDKFLEYFFTEADVLVIKDLGFNTVRLGVNYHHFEDDDNPRVFKHQGLKHLDRVVDLCAKHGIYTIIDLHTLPGGQNGDWHSDNPTDKALFWVHKDFQDRAVILWESLAEHYKNNTWVAGFNVMNEPAEETGEILNKVMIRLEKAIRVIDPNHILFWDGNTYGSDFRCFKEPLPNSVYACHDYSTMGLPGMPQYYNTPEDKAKLAQSIQWKSEYQRSINGPIWNGEFGPVYANPEEFPDHEDINGRRYALLMEQLRLYNSYPNISWTIWCWKDVGVSGLVRVDPESVYQKMLKPFSERAKKAGIHGFGVDISNFEDIFKPMWDWMCEVAPSVRTKYPRLFAGTRGKILFRPVRLCILAEEFVPEYCEYFRNKSFDELDEIAKSFHMGKCNSCVEILDICVADIMVPDNCIKRERLHAMLREAVNPKKSTALNGFDH